MSDNSSVCDAINMKRLAGFEYPDDEGVYHHRTVEPYAHGVTSAGDEAMYGYQVAGVSESIETIPGWRVFRLNRMRNLETVQREFKGDAPGREHVQNYLDSIHCQIS